MDTQKSIIYDSFKHIRKLPLRLVVFTPDNKPIVEKNISVNQMVVRKTEHFNRIEFKISEDEAIADFKEILDNYYSAKNEYGYNSYLSITGKTEEDNDNTVIFFISISNISYFDSYETSTGEQIYTTLVDEEFYTMVNGVKTRGGIYEELVKTEKRTNEEEKKFIKETLLAQEALDWFPTEKEAKEQKKRIEKEKKKKSGGGGLESLFGVKKKEEKNQQQDAVRGEQGEFINPKSLKIHEGSENPDYELSNIIGLENVKKDIQKMQYMLEYEQNRKDRGIVSHDIASLHMCFMGNPGTGKTTIARIMTGILYSMKYIKINKCLEVSGLDLKGGYIGQTAIITKQIVDMARGGILFIDEAYALCEERGNSFGKEAISVLLKEMEDNRGDLIVIFAGYEDDMNKFLNVNPGFRSRINKYFDFKDYTTIELSKIFINYIKKMHLKISEDALTRCIDLFNEAKKHPNFSNGRFVRNLTEQIEEMHILNSVDDANVERMDIVINEDVPDSLIEKMLYGM